MKHVLAPDLQRLDHPAPADRQTPDRPASVGAAAGEEVEGVRARRAGRPRGTRPRRRPSPGRLQTSAAPSVPHTPRESIPKARPSALLATAHRLGQAGRLALDDGPGALGGEVAGPEPGPAGRHDQAGEAAGERRAARAATASTPSAATRWSTTAKPGGDEPLDQRPARTCPRGCPSATPSETVSTFATSERRGIGASGRPSGRRPRADRARRGRGIGGVEDRRCRRRGCRPRPRPRAARSRR